ncbi:hypothetical protein N9954_03100 [Maribacter sp.]|nr:hypothetical protein [Maribacter sp.]
MTDRVLAQQKANSKIVLIISLVIFACIGFVTLSVAAYHHSDGSPYAMGYEFGGMLRSFLSFTTLKNGVGLGTLIAVHCSWERNKSILWAILHAAFGWAYVIYFATKRNAN